LVFKSFGQKLKKGIWSPYKVGVLYNYGNENNFLFDDKDYSYKTNTYKAQFFYKLGSWKSLNFDLIAQPQVQFLTHKLLNPSFVQPRHGDNYLELREIYTKKKSMNLYAFELTVTIKKQLLNKLEMQFGVGGGIAIINTKTERLANGFTFIENFSIGISHQTFKDTSIYLGTNFGHVSNLNFLSPNDGYNVLGIEFGISYALKRKIDQK
jgi:hypothetical protein